MTASYQKDLFTKRWRGVRAPDPREHQLQISLVERLHWQCRRDDVTYWHTPNGEQRDKRVAAKLKAMGVLPGVSDLTFLIGNGQHKPDLLFLELKARGGSLSDEQKIFQDRVEAIGSNFAVADTIEAAVAVLVKFGILPGGR
jgi:VRR-NUC domain